ncbi:RNA pol II transcription cofactor [Parahypoxylon ruwenzoriense]
MRTLSISISILVAVLSIVLFREHVFEFGVTTLNKILVNLNRYSNNDDSSSSSSIVTDSTTTSTQQDNQPESTAFYNPTEKLIATDMSVPRAIRKVFLANSVPEGAGATVRRSIGTPQLRNFSPFLMLDHFSIKPGSGFPDHPHRGQETITYLLSGAVDHEDFAGHAGTIEAGDLQFMTAGRGIMHAEMPRQNPDGSANIGLQLWVDLPAHLKACEPRYRDLRAEDIPFTDLDDGNIHIKVISGQAGGVDSVKDLAYTPVWILDVEMKPGSKLAQPLPKGWNAFAYQLEGSAVFGSGDGKRTVAQYHNCVFEPDGDVITVEMPATATEKARFVLIAGQVLNQKVIQYGPFVLNTAEEVRQALIDYQFHMNGFERAKDWQSEIGKSMIPRVFMRCIVSLSVAWLGTCPARSWPIVAGLAHLAEVGRLATISICEGAGLLLAAIADRPGWRRLLAAGWGCSYSNSHSADLGLLPPRSDKIVSVRRACYRKEQNK